MSSKSAGEYASVITNEAMEYSESTNETGFFEAMQRNWGQAPTYTPVTVREVVTNEGDGRTGYGSGAFVGNTLATASPSEVGRARLGPGQQLVVNILRDGQETHVQAVIEQAGSVATDLHQDPALQARTLPQPVLPDRRLPHVNRFIRHDLVRSVGPTDDTACPICKEDMPDPALLACGHSFCPTCILHWVQSQLGNSCPMCRRPLFTRYPYPLQRYDETVFLWQRRLFRVTHHADWQTAVHRWSGWHQVRLIDREYAARCAYDRLANPVQPLDSTMVFLPFEELEMHIEMMHFVLPGLWHTDLPMEQLMQWMAIKHTMKDILQNEWRDQEGPRNELLESRNGMDLVDSIISRHGRRHPAFTNDPDTDPLEKWCTTTYDSPPGNLIFEPLADGCPPPDFYCWMFYRLCHHILLLGVPF